MQKGLGIDRHHSLEALIRASDAVSFHVPLNAETRHMLSAEVLASAEKGGNAAKERGLFIVNTARGGVVEEQAVAAALLSDTSRVAGVALDVLEQEPPQVGEHPLLCAAQEGANASSSGHLHACHCCQSRRL